MKTVLAEIQALERKIAETYESYKKKHPNTKKTRNDPMFKDQDKLETVEEKTKRFRENPPKLDWSKITPDMMDKEY
jgi:hypothetical protein